MFHRVHSTIFALLFLAGFIVNTFILQDQSIGLILLVTYVGFYGWELGGVITQTEKAILRWWLGVWMLLSLIMILLTASYYIWKVTPELIYVTILLTPPVLLWACRKATLGRSPTGEAHLSLFAHAHDLWHGRRHHIPRVVWITTSAIVLLMSLFFLTLVQNPVVDAVRSVWERLPVSVFVLFILVCALMFGLLSRGKERAISLLFFCTFLFAFLSVAALVFPIGFGFDSFIHKATELHLAEFGTITPKPFYYIGQYVLVLFLHHGFLIPIDLADTFLVPTLTALLLPAAWFFAAAHITRKRSIAMMSLMGLFLIPLSNFVVTTPQALANLWTLLLVLASVPYLLEKEHPRLRVLFVSAMATVLIHPIAGIPGLLYFMFLATDPSRTNPRTPKTNHVVRVFLIAVACVILPLSFVVNALMNQQQLGINLAALNPLTWISTLNLTIFFENKFSPLLDLVYLYGLNAALLLILLALFAWREYHKDLSRRFFAILLTVMALSVNYLIMSTALEFSFLIDYERTNYAARLLPLITFFLTPYVILGLGHVFMNLKTQPLVLRASALLLLITIAGSSFYLAYPRRDAYETNRGFNVSQADIDAVYLAEEMAQGNPYLALANQSVSAAAIQEIGFRYFDDLFFYPIPTGGELYDHFLLMNESPTRQTAQATLDIVPMHGDVTILFFLVNSYWWDAPRIIETAKSTADDWRSVGEGQVYVFRYDF